MTKPVIGFCFSLSASPFPLVPSFALGNNVDMKIEKQSNGEFRLESPSGTRFLSFLSTSAFRFRMKDVPASFSVKPIALVDDGIEVGEYWLSYGDLRVEVSPSFALTVYFKGQKALCTLPFVQKEETIDASLAEKEGHAANSSGEYEGGIGFAFDGPVYGLGDKTGPLDKRGYGYVNWNTDDPTPHSDTYKSLYKSIPFLLLFSHSCTAGLFFDNTSKCLFDIGKRKKGVVEYAYAEGGLDLYCFFGAMPDVISDYTSLLGRTPLPPRKALGNQQSRWSYSNEDELLSMVKGYEDADIPLSMVHFDIDYMDRYMDFTVNSSAFPDFPDLLSRLKEKGIGACAIIDAGVKALEGYPIYDEGMEKGYFCTLNGDVYHGEVWPGDSVFPAFAKKEVRAWWAENVFRFLEKTGLTGIENDMNEPSSFKGPLPDDVDMGGLPHSAAHNVYGHWIDEATFAGFAKADKRPYIITRAAYAGTSAFAATWSGDNQSSYDHLRFMIPQLCNLSLSGFVNCGVDIGGFGGDTTSELLTRWYVAALFNPLYRNHSSLATIKQEPFAFDELTTKRIRKAILTRYELLPTLYDSLFLHLSSGLLPLRPLVYNFPEDENVYNENTSLMLGESLLLAPSLFPGQSKRAAYFPDGFYGYFDGKHYDKGYHLIDCSLDDIPLFVRDHSLLCLNPVGTKSTAYSDVLRLYWTMDEAATYHYEDDGDTLAYQKGAYNLFLLRADREKGVCVIPVHLGIPTHYAKIEIDTPDGGHFVSDFSLKGQ